MSERGMLDCFGVPEVFATHRRMENAGGGCIRIINCITRDGVLTPVSAVVFPAHCLLKFHQTAQDFAREVVLTELEDATAH